MGTTINDLPRQRIARSKKTAKWGKAVIEDLEKLSYTDSYNGRSTRHRKQINYDLYNGKINLDDFEYVINPYGFKENEFPATLQHYDIISPKINLLLGEEIKRPFTFRCVSSNADAITELEEKKKEYVITAYQEYISALAQGEDGEPEKKKLKQMDKYLKFSFSDIRERTGQHIINYLLREQDLVYKFNAGFKDALISGEELYWTGIVSGEPVVRVCNPLDLTIIMDPGSDFVENATAIIEERWMSLPSILDEYYLTLKDKEAKSLERDYGSGGQNFGEDTNSYPTANIIIKGDGGSTGPSGMDRRSQDADGTIRVLRCEWKSQRKVGFVYTIEDGLEVVELVDETFELPEESSKDTDGYHHFNDSRLKWYWISEYWEGTKIGKDIYVDVQPRQNQRRSIDNPSICKSGYTGLIYNARNSESVSLIDRMKAYQYLYNIIFYRLELASAKSKGKVALMDVAQIPGGEGWDVDKWMYYLDAMGIMFINSAEEGNRGQQANFNQFQSIDLTMGNYIQTHIALLGQIEDKIGQLAGVSRQREGQTMASELVGNVERSISQSSHITEIWFYQHNEVKRRTIEALVDVARIAWRKGKKINFVTDDLGRSLLSIDGTEFSNTQYGVHVGNTAKDNAALETAKQLLQTGIQSDKVSLSEAVTVLQSESLSDIRVTLEQGEEDVAQRNQQAQESAQKSAESINQAVIADKQADRDIDREKNIRDNETKLQIAFKPEDTEVQDTSLDERKLDSVHQQHRDKMNLEREKQAEVTRKNTNELSLKREDLAIKKKAANNRPTGSK